MRMNKEMTALVGASVENAGFQGEDVSQATLAVMMETLLGM